MSTRARQVVRLVRVDVPHALIGESGVLIVEADQSAEYWSGGSVPLRMLEDPEATFAIAREFEPDRSWAAVPGDTGKMRAHPPKAGPWEHVVGHRWMAEFHTGVISELLPLQPDWLTVLRIGYEGEHLVFNEQPLRTVGSQEMSVTESWVRRKSERIYRDLLHDVGARTPVHPAQIVSHPAGEVAIARELANRFEDAAIHARALDAQFVASDAFAGVAMVAGQLSLPGGSSLRLLVPNVGGLPWEAICEFRAHPGAHEARELMGEFEHRALDSAPQDAAAFLNGVGAEVVHGLFGAVDDSRPKLPALIAEDLASTAISLIPVVGTFAALGAGVSESVGRSVSFSRSWVAALMTLRSPRTTHEQRG